MFFYLNLMYNLDMFGILYLHINKFLIIIYMPDNTTSDIT